MEIVSIPADAPVRAAASVVLLRDGPGGLETFLLKRHGDSDVLAGALVFPGGKLDAEDALPATLARLDMPSATLHAALGEPALEVAEAAALYVAALRETFEETGLRFGTGAALCASALVPWSRWVTPVLAAVVRKRFDTRFFLAEVPPGQAPRHDDHEAVDSLWLTPRDALQRYAERQIELAPPQLMGMAQLARHRTVACAMQAARGRKPPTVRPESFEEEGVRVMCYPGDERHSVKERALPGPTRLYVRDRRFEPAGGPGAWFEDR